ncbi:MAG: hydantoinase/oxoprolinase family protein [Gammaproteobacteria bacterium]|nr:hydantoinase/oxoprolinase family protein [Gammaproteobacteria bacterium]
MRIGIDVGGTFTDVVGVDDMGHTYIEKAPTTPQDPSEGVIKALQQLAERQALSIEQLLARTERVVHGTTVATNALLERKGANVALLTTEGHRDVLEMREGLKDDRYNLRLPPPPPLVPRHQRLGVRERIKANGDIAITLDQTSLDAAIDVLRAKEVDAVAICYLHAYREPAHEQATRDAVSKALPNAYVCISSEVLPQIKEFERVSTTVVNAYVGPVVARYFARLEGRLKDAGYAGNVLIVLSHGGVAPVAQATELAAGTVLSGPAGGVAGAKHCAHLLDTPNLIAFDMGGTSSDISLIVDADTTLSSERSIAGQRLGLPSLDIVTLGAGGGSIASVDAGGVLHVGPASAGASPGPACYGRGGQLATVTDANLALGYVNAENFHGGRTNLDVEAATRALTNLAESLGLSVERTAAGIHEVVNTRMAEGMRLVSIRRGVDPRNFALLAFGGAAGLHATELARALSMGRVIIPKAASVLSAWGMLNSDLRFEVSRTHIGDTQALDAQALRDMFVDLENEGREQIASWFDGPTTTRRSADMRYGEQIFEIDVPLDDVNWAAADVIAQVEQRFHARHETLFTYALPEQEVVLVNARVAVIGELERISEHEQSPQTSAPAPTAHRPVYLGGWCDTPVFQLEDLGATQTIAGPAMIESETTSVLLRAGDVAKVNALGWIDIAVDTK